MTTEQLHTILLDENDAFLVKYRAIIDYLRPKNPEVYQSTQNKIIELTQWLIQNVHSQNNLSHALTQWLIKAKISPALLHIGIPTQNGIFAELSTRIHNKLLPSPTDINDFESSFSSLFIKSTDAIWIEAIGNNHWQKFFQSLILPDEKINTYALNELLYSLEILSIWIAAEEYNEEFIRLDKGLFSYHSPFVALHREIITTINPLRLSIDQNQLWTFDNSHIEVLIEQCKDLLTSLKKKSIYRGISVSLTYRFVRIDQLLDRTLMLSKIVSDFNKTDVSGYFVNLFKEAVHDVSSRKSISGVMQENFKILSLSITNNTSHHGEHYVATNKKEYLHILASAAGAGIIIAFMALIKVKIASLGLTHFTEMILVSLNYGLGFIIVHLFGFTIATKQPAMTASTIAHAIEKGTQNKTHLDKLSNLIISVGRSQFAAIVGNVTLALGVAFVIGYLYSMVNMTPIFSQHKSEHYLHDLLPSSALIFAAVAGVWLFISGLIAGYFDNRADYLQLETRYNHHPILIRLMSADRRAKLAHYLHENHGALIGNFLFGVLLGVTPFIGYIFEIDLQIRHIAFSTANLGYAAASIPLETKEFFMYLGFALMIGMVNLIVSFSLALNVALRARGTKLGSFWKLLKTLGGKFFKRPKDFLIPPA
jgi:site-specific recombinase